MALKLNETIPHNENSALELPERFLWLAVVERALKDYCFFFDRLSGPDQSDRVMQVLVNFKQNKFRYNTKKVIAEYDRLNWFLFETVPTPFNLEYICTELYEDGNGVASCFRIEAKKLLNRHILDSRAEERFPEIITFMRTRENEPTVNADPLNKNNFRTKRYRAPNADS
jgi:hypothetical protein